MNEHLANQSSAPALLYGTAWKEEDTKRCVIDALSVGFRGIDTANQRKHYNEAGVGDALRECYQRGIIQRKDLFLQTKFTYINGQDHRLPYEKNADLQTQVFQSFDSSLNHLHTDYIDSLILHGPWARGGLSSQDIEVWQAMETLCTRGQVGNLGISNTSLLQLQELCSNASIKPAFVQNRCYASEGWDQAVRQFCLQQGIIYQGFSLLTANQPFVVSEVVADIAERLAVSAAQVIFAFALKVGMLPLTGTTDMVHMKEDLASARLILNATEVTRIEAIAGSF